VVDFGIERKAVENGFKKIAGFDEVGRGALFGPVVAAGIMFTEDLIQSKKKGWLGEINDSKLLSPRRREELSRLILTSADSIGVGMVSHQEIDEKNIHWASLEAMRRAVEKMRTKPDLLLVDGFTLDSVDYPQIKVPQGDRKSISIAAASIIAKVSRDKLMYHLDKIYEGYALAKNKGYGTKEHYRALKKLGPSSMHRQTFNLGDKKER
jgi:ribonuclease HII